MAATESTVAVVDPIRDSSSWDGLISHFPGSTTFHTTAWARVLSESYGYTPLYLVASNKGTRNASAALPLFEVKSWLTGRRGISLPFTDECGPLAIDEASSRIVCERAVKMGQERSWETFELRGVKERTPPPERALGSSFFGHVLELKKGESKLFEAVSSPVRKAIRKAEREDIQVRIERTPLALRAYYRLHCLTRKRHGLPPQPWRFFESIQRHLFQVNGGVVALSYWRDLPVAGAVFFCHGRSAVYKYGASNYEFQNLRASNRVMWEAMRWLLKNGFEVLNFGRTSVQNEGLRRFKLGWGATEYPIDYQKFDYGTNTFVSEPDEAYGWYNAVFSRLPLWLSRLAGAFLYRHWA